MSKAQLSTVLASVLVGTGIAILAFWRVSSKLPAPPPAAPEVVAAGANAAGRSSSFAMAPLPHPKEVESLVRRHLDQLEPSPPNTADLASAVSRALEAYTSDSPESFLRWMKEQQLTPPPEYETAELAVAQWQVARKGLHGATFDLSNCEFAHRVRAGQVLFDASKGDMGSVKLSMSRSNRGKGDVDAKAVGSDSIEILVPARLRLADGEQYNGRLGLVFSMRPSDGRWIIVKTTVGGAPAGRADIPFPPPV